MNKILFLFFLCTFSLQAFAYNLVVIQSTSRENQTFITRTGKKDGTMVGKRSTFTTTNVSIIAKAIVVTREFTQWEIENQYTDLPFEKGEIVTMYDSTEYLWALNPDQAKSRLLKTQQHVHGRSVEGHIAITRGLFQTTSANTTEDTDRGGFSTEVYFHNEVNNTFSFALGFRYSREVINTSSASTVNQIFLGVGEARYNFPRMRDFYNARFGLGLGAGFGQSYSETETLSSFGDAYLLPSTKVMLVIPRETYDFAVEVAFDSINTSEEFEDGTIEKTTISSTKLGVLWRKPI